MRRTIALALGIACVVVAVAALADASRSPRSGPPATLAPPADDERTARDGPPTYRLAGTQILRDGEPFVPLGVNILGPDGFFNVDAVTHGHARTLREDWRFNTVRLNSCLPEGCTYGVHNEHNDDLDALVDEYTGEGLVVIIALHQVKPGHWPDGPLLDRIEQWWRDIARRYAGRQDVWFNLLNEPGSEQPALPRWLELHARLLRAVRDEGAPNIVVVDGAQWGQEAGTRLPERVEDEDSAFLSFGRTLQAIDDQVLFSFHVYDQWGPPEVDDAERDERLADYIDRVHAAGLPLLIGEVGGHDEPCCEREALGAAAAYRVAPTRGVGLLAWHAQSVDHNRLVARGKPATTPADLDDPVSPTNLTWQGRLLWNLTHR